MRNSLQNSGGKCHNQANRLRKSEAKAVEIENL